MNRIRITLILLLACLSFPSGALAQILRVEDQKVFTDSLVHDLEFGPYFGLYKDNYFIAGTNPLHKPTSNNSDVKFQISLQMRITPPSLPWGTYLFIMYSQKAFWDVFKNSMPMHDLNYNPGIGWTKPFFSKGRYVGKLTMLVEHESNGRDSIQSRSWNRISFCGSVLVNKNLMVHAKYWIPIVDGENNKDILDYKGIFQGGFVYTTDNKRWSFGLTWVKRKGWNLNFNSIWDLTWKISKKSNLDLFVQYYNGYGESLLDYNKFHSRLRAGIVFKPYFFSEF